MIEENWKFVLWLTTGLSFITPCLTKLACDPEAVRQINRSDVESHYIEIGDSFDRVIEGGQHKGVRWRSYVAPNTGNLTFKDTFMIIGLTTQGQYFPDYIYGKGYVSQFSLQYTDSLDIPYDDYGTQVFRVSSPSERFFYFSEPITVKAMQLTILDGFLAGQWFESKWYYYWYLDLIGCVHSQTNEVFMCSNETNPTNYGSDDVSITPTPTSCTINRNHTITVTTSCYYCSNSIEHYDQVSVAANLQASSNASHFLLSTASVLMHKSCNLQLMVAIVPSAVLLILLHVTIVSWVIFAKLSRKKIPRTEENRSSSNIQMIGLTEMKDGKVGILRDLQNSALYDESPTLQLNSSLSTHHGYHSSSGVVDNARQFTATTQLLRDSHQSGDLLLSRMGSADNNSAISQQQEESIYTEIYEPII